MCVCMYVCMCVCVCVTVCVCVCVCVCLCLCGVWCVYLFPSLRPHLWLAKRGDRVCERDYMCVYVTENESLCVCVFVLMCMCVCVGVFMCMCVCDGVLYKCSEPRSSRIGMVAVKSGTEMSVVPPAV